MKELPLTQGKFALVDDEDYERLSEYSWCVSRSRNGKLRCHRMTERPKRKDIPLANEVLQITELVDHKSGDGLDCQKSNLRVCTLTQNNQNRKKTKSKTSSKYKGIHFHIRSKKWQAQIGYTNILGNRAITQIGSFLIEEEAAKAYDEFARYYHGEFAALNFPKEGERSCLC